MEDKKTFKIPYLYLIIIGILLAILLTVVIFVIKNNTKKEQEDSEANLTTQIRKENQMIDSEEEYDESEIPEMTEYETSGVSVNYPTSWTVDGDALSDTEEVIVQYNSEDQKMRVNISKVELEEVVSLDDYIANVKEQYPLNDTSLEIVSTEKILVDGVEAAKVIYTFDAQGTLMRTIQLYTTIETTAYIVNIAVVDSAYEGKKIEISAFVNSLKFNNMDTNTVE